ncbi:hypothetical protein R3P38DRAFT_3175558 [Favolaschia claudopus]|uniref:Uncharacterized protein n=1 Tax=Favolaschia claudopus TaxID=2862362 RepID=A0AAW0D1F7_9AGAR
MSQQSLVTTRLPIFSDPNDPELVHQLFTARRFSTSGRNFTSIHTICATDHSMAYPCVEAAMIYTYDRPRIHRAAARITHRTPSGADATTTFICFFQRSRTLPHNDYLDIQGEVIIMRAQHDGVTVTNMPVSEAHLADRIVEKLAPALRQFQGPKRTPVGTLIIVA